MPVAFIYILSPLIVTNYDAIICKKEKIILADLLFAMPVPPGNAKHIYTDENHLGRIIVYGFPNDESVYYCVQEFTGNFNLETVDTSEIYQCEDALPSEGFASLIDISEQIL